MASSSRSWRCSAVRNAQVALVSLCGRRYLSTSQLHQPVRLSRHFVPTLRAESTGHESVESVSRLLRGGYMRQSSSGFYSLLPNGLRMIKKIERIIDEEMASIGASKLEMPTMLSSTLWHKSGRVEAMGSELYKVRDRRGTEFVLGPTFEEEVTKLVGDEVQSWRQLPVKVYQITQKHRDEPRPRSGLLRTRGFLMKDLYTFDASIDAAQQSYDQVRTAYGRIMTRLFGEQGAGWRVAEADSGAMGGIESHEYQVADELGEDALLTCDKCGYSANSEMAKGRPHSLHARKPAEADDVQVKLYGVADKSEHSCTMTAVVVSKERAFNPIKVAKHVHATSPSTSHVAPAEQLYPTIKDDASMWDWEDRPEGPMVRFERLRIVLDSECEALESDEVHAAVLHAIEQYASPPGAQVPTSERPHDAPELRDYFPGQVHSSYLMADTAYADIRQTEDGDACASCFSGTLQKAKTVEVGHTFLLGTRYSHSLGYSVAVPKESQVAPSLSVPLQMGCYGIGLTRILGVLAQAACRHFDALAADAKSSTSKRTGLAWNWNVAPFRALMVPLRPEDTVQAEAVRRLSAAVTIGHVDFAKVVGSECEAATLAKLQALLIDVNPSDIAIDDREGMTFGAKLNEADLVGYPVIFILGKHFDKSGEVEVRFRDTVNHTAKISLSSLTSLL